MVPHRNGDGTFPAAWSQPVLISEARPVGFADADLMEVLGAILKSGALGPAASIDVRFTPNSGSLAGPGRADYGAVNRHSDLRARSGPFPTNPNEVPSPHNRGHPKAPRLPEAVAESLTLHVPRRRHHGIVRLTPTRLKLRFTAAHESRRNW